MPCALDIITAVSAPNFSPGQKLSPTANFGCSRSLAMPLRAFYEKHGFEIIARGFEPTWQLDDVQYEWVDKQE